jgi:hypothetical protein
LAPGRKRLKYLAEGGMRMRRAAAVAVLLLFVACAGGQPPMEGKVVARFGIEPDLNNYPQATPKETLASVLKAIERQRVGYLLAHLADPRFVDERVQRYAGNFDELEREVAVKLTSNPDAVKELRQFLREGEWEGGDTAASAQLKNVKDRRVFMRKSGGRWFFENRWDGTARPPGGEK